VDQDDLPLITRCQEGDLAAFEPLVEKYRQRVFRLAYQIVRDRDEARDVAQEAFIRAYQSIGSFRGRSAFYTWLFRIVVNLATDHVRQRTARGRVLGGDPVPDSELEARLPDDPAARPDQAALRAEERRRIGRALDALPPHHRTIIMLSDIEGLSYREIADVLDIPMGTVMSRLHNARKRLRALLGPLLLVVTVLAASLLGLPTAGPVDAQQAVRFGARILLATDAPSVPRSPVAQTPDEHLSKVLEKLRAVFRYRDYTTLERYRAEVPIGSKQQWIIPGDRLLEVVPEEVVRSAVRMRLRLARGGLTEVNANIQAQPGHPALIGGPQYNDGVLIIVIWANPNP
jgi:RNA polymerase sigma-70 factor (ECF subfamily)